MELWHYQSHALPDWPENYGGAVIASSTFGATCICLIFPFLLTLMLALWPADGEIKSALSVLVSH